MSHSIHIITKDKASKYKELVPQIDALIKTERNHIANLANITAVLKEVFDWFWIGFYLVDNEQELILAPFQGSLACTRIKKGRGVCGKSWETAKTIIVEDVNSFADHIACSSLSQSEIVVPIIHKGIVLGVLDIDSTEFASFDTTDQEGLEPIATIIANMLALK